MLFVLNLREIRKKKGISQLDLATTLGIRQATLSGYECGTIRMNNEMIMRVCFALDITPNELLGWEQAYKDYVRQLMAMKKEG